MRLFFAVIGCILLSNFCFSQVAVTTAKEPFLQKLDATDLENRVIEHLNLDQNRINFITSKELDTRLNETVVVIGEIENEILDEETAMDYTLTSHIVSVNAITGEIKQHYSEGSPKNGWHSNAVYISEISIEPRDYKLAKEEVAFGIKTVFRSSSQPNPYSSAELSLYSIQENSIKKVLDNFVIAEYSGEVNVNINSCYAALTNETNVLSVLESRTNGYYDLQINNTIINSIFELDATGECEPVEKSKVEKTSVLKYTNTNYSKVL